MPLEYITGDLKSAVNGINGLTGSLRGQAGRLNGLSGDYAATADDLNNVGIGNLLKYGEVSENDLVGQATTDNTLSYGKAWDTANRNLTRMGINPNSGRFAGMNQSYALARAAAEAGARNQARIQARNENFSRAGSLASMGKDYSGMALNAASAAGNMLNAAASNQDRYVTNLSGLYKENENARMADARAAVNAELGQRGYIMNGRGEYQNLGGPIQSLMKTK